MEDDATTRALNKKNAEMLAAIRRRNQARGNGGTPDATGTPTPPVNHSPTPSCDSGTSSARCD